MNIKIAGQSSKSNYRNTGSCGGAVIYNEHELRDLPQLFQELEVKPEDLAWFDMDGHVVTGAEVMDKIGRLTGHLGKNDAKFYCTMINPSDDEALAMGATVDEQITNGRPFVFDVMDAYAENFHRQGVKDRHDLVAFAIPHVFKSEGKQQIHWHVIQARKDATNKYKLSPLTNHKNTTKGAVHGGFDRVAFDAECEKRFDIRYNYERRVEQSFNYLLAEKKGSVEEKAVQETRLALQNLPELKESIQAAITRRVERLAKEAAARAAEERRLAAEKLAGEPETFVIHGDMDATLYSSRPSPWPKNLEKLHEAARSILKYRTWGASVRCNHPEEFVEDAMNGQQFGTVTFNMNKARYVGGDRSDGMLENPDEVIQFADHTGRNLDLFTPEFWDYWRLQLASLKSWLARLSKKTPAVEPVEKAPAPQQKQQEPAAAKPKPVAAPASAPEVAPAPTPKPAAKPSFEVVQTFKANYYQYRIKKEQDGLMKLQKLDVDKKSPVVDGKYTGKVWYTKEKFTSYKEVGHDADGVYFKIQDTAGKTRYINQNGIDLSQKKKQQLGLVSKSLSR